MTRVFNAKIVLCGDSSVGKTSIRRNYMGLSFERDHISTLGADFALKKVPIQDDRLDLQIWDLGGQLGYERLRSRYFAGAKGALVVFDLTNPESFVNLPHWFQELWEYTGEKETPVVILGNKCDLVDDIKVNEDEIMAFIKEFQHKHQIQMPYTYHQTSAKDGINIDVAFDDLVKEMYDAFLLELGLQ